MKNTVKYGVVAFMLCISAATYGQAPASVELDKEYYQHGYNSTGGPNLTQEERDSVTISSTMKYFVLPDATANPNYKYDTPANAQSFDNVLSTFTWGFRRSGGAALGTTTGSPTNKHIISIQWNTVGVDTIRVNENPVNGCLGTETKIPVAIIPKPTITFNQVGNPSSYSDGACATQTEVDNGIDYSFPVTAISQSSQVKIDYTITFTPVNGIAEAPVNVQSATVSGGSFTVNLKNTGNRYGSYEITITKVTDRISRKSGIESTGTDLLTSGGSATFTYNVLKPVETGPIYRLPNYGNY